MIKKNNILICPLNWGLGHATRCVPIIRGLLDLGQNPIIAADKAPLSFLQNEFPDIETIRLPGFEPSYSKGNSQVFKLMTLIPGALHDFRKEHRDIEDIVEKYNIDIVVSDNRFGCWSQKVHSVFITHQLHIQTPRFFKWTSPIINSISRSYLKKYNELWIPDVEDEPSLSGVLSHPADMKIKTTYIGPLSRFGEETQVLDKDIDCLVVLSGPEPQRTILEEIVLTQSRDFDGKIVVLRAKPSASDDMDISLLPDNVTFYNHADDELFAELISRAKNIVCRGGYSSLMDLVVLGRNAFLVPTPGQTEQEYLADYLTKRGLFNSCRQKDFQLKNINIPDKNPKDYFNDNQYNLNEFLENWLSRF